MRESLTGDWVAAIEAEEFAEKMSTQYPEAWEEWCRAFAVQHITVELARYERRQRSRALSPASIFAAAAEGGDGEVLSLFRVTFSIDDTNTRRPFGQMDGSDCRYVADDYRQSSRRALFMAAFLDAVAKRVKAKTVAEVLTEAQCRKMLQSLGGNGDELGVAA